MRLFFTLLIAIGTLNTACGQLTNGLVAHWNFNGNANDITGNGYNGTATSISYTAGKLNMANTAAEFNGSGSYISVPYQSGLNVSQYTICAMVKIKGFYTGTCQASMILSRGGGYASGAYSLQFNDNGYDNSCSIVDTSKNLFLGHAGPGSPQLSLPFKKTPTLVSGRWYCVTSVYDGDSLRFYIDGDFKYAVDIKSPLGTSTAALSIGSDRFTNFALYPYWLNGILDDLRLYNRALTPAEIREYCGMFDTIVALKDTARHACPDDTFHLGYVVTETFGTGNVFTAQMSDANGNFTTPVTLGSVTSGIGGTIVCTVPPSVTPGGGYKVRVVSTNPVRVTDIPLKLSIYNRQPATITIAANPAGPIQPNQSVTYVATTGNAGPNPVIIWFRNGLQIPGINNDSLTLNTLNEDDSIYAVVKSSNPCALSVETKSNVIYIEIGLSVNMIYLGNLHVYPNPNNGSFNIAASDIQHTQVNIEIFNATGQRVYAKQALPVNNTINEHINIPEVANGIYLLRISADGKDRNIRLLIRK